MLVQILKDKHSKTTKMIEVNLDILIKNPMVGVEKNNLPLMNGWVNEIGVRDSNNLSWLSWLFLDYDGTMSIEDFCMVYNRFNFFLYTTSSHTKEKNKFRVIMPLEEPISIEKYTNILRCSLSDFFPECDKTAFYKDHFFFIPAKQNEDYGSFVNYGRLFSIHDIKDQIVSNTMKYTKTTEYLPKKQKNFKDISEDIRIKIREIVNKADGSGRYEELFELIGKYKRWYREVIIEELEWSNYKNKNQMIKTARKEAN